MKTMLNSNFKAGKLGRHFVVVLSITTTMNVSPDYSISWTAPVTLEQTITTDSLPEILLDSTVKLENAPTIQLNKNASRFVKDMMRRENEALTKVRQRSNPYFTTIDNVFE